MSESRGVHFASSIQVRSIGIPEALDRVELWYSYEEMRLMHQQLQRDMRNFSNILASNIVDPQEPSTFEDYLIHRVGLERLISPDAIEQAQAIMNNRSEHVRTVLIAVERLRDIGEVVEEDPAHISEASSREARNRAHRDAVRQLRI